MGNKLLGAIIFMTITMCLLFQNCSDMRLQGKPETFSTMNLKVDYCEVSDWKYDSFFVSNKVLKEVSKKISSDLDGDGLEDAFEQNVNNKDYFAIDYKNFDTFPDGYSDLVMVRGGYSLEEQQNLRDCTEPDLDTDGDGLNDCEELLLFTNELNPDTDNDGITDYLEIRSRLSATDPNDAFLDSDSDSISNIVEIQKNTNPLEGTPDSVLSYYNYSIQQTQISDISNPNCYSLIVDAIPRSKNSTEDRIQVYIIEKNSRSEKRMRNVELIVNEKNAVDIGRVAVQLNQQISLKIDGRSQALVIEGSR